MILCTYVNSIKRELVFEHCDVRVYLIQTSLFYVTNENIDGNCQVCRWETLGSVLFSLFMIIISFFYRIYSESLRGKKHNFFSDFEFFFNFKIKDCRNLVTAILNVK